MPRLQSDRSGLAYDAAGQQTLRWDARNIRTTYGYDSVSRETSTKYPDGTRVTIAVCRREKIGMLLTRLGRSADAMHTARKSRRRSVVATWGAT